MSSEKPAAQKDRVTIAEVFDHMYKESHPNGPYPPVEIKPKPEPKSSQS